MSPKMGRPPSANPKTERIFIRVTAEEKSEIMAFCSEKKLTCLDLIRKGMKAVINK